MGKTSDNLPKPDSFFCERFGVTSSQISGVIGRILGGPIDDADLYFEYRVNEVVSLEEGLVKKVTRGLSQGVGARAMSGEKTGYAFSDEITGDRLIGAAKTARHIAADGGHTASVFLTPTSPFRDLYPLHFQAVDLPASEKVSLLYEVDRAARGYDPKIVNVMASLSCEYKIVMIVRSDGLVVGDVQPLVRLSVACISEEAGQRQVGSFGGGGRVEFSFFREEGRYAAYAREAARQAVLNLRAVEAPAGMMTVVLGPGWPGILLHEAVGHGLEGDFNRKRLSAFTDRIGQKVASELCTVVDDGTLPFRRGSLNVDDEGTPTGRTILIERGILRRYLQDRLNARLMKMPVTGNGRRESYAHPPLPRMTNTFMLPGDASPEEIIRSVKRGLYTVAFGGGQVDITSGKFVFSASEAYLIEDGRVTHPVRGATLIGNGPDVLTRVTMVGNDLSLDSGVGTCGKDGQTVPVGVGLPTLRVDGITVGGTGG